MRESYDGEVSRAGRSEDDILVEKNGRDIGAYVMQPLAGLMQVNADNVIGIGTGVAGAGLGTYVAKTWGHKISPFVTNYAPLVGGVLGAVASIPLGAWRGPKVAAQGLVASVLTGIALFGLQKLGVISGTGALVMQRVRGLQGYGQPMGALPQPQVYGTGKMPVKVKQGIDKGVYGKTWA